LLISNALRGHGKGSSAKFKMKEMPLRLTQDKLPPLGDALTGFLYDNRSKAANNFVYSFTLTCLTR